jgi:hypothetical protein
MKIMRKFGLCVMVGVVLFVLIPVLASAGGQKDKLPPLETFSGDYPEWALASIPPDDVLYGIGVGFNLGTEKSIMELARFYAQADICRQMSTPLRYVTYGNTNSPGEAALAEKLAAYQNGFYEFTSLLVSYEASFAFSEYTKVVRRAKGADGSIWCLMSITKSDAEKALAVLNGHMEKTFEAYTEELDTLYP